MKATPESLGQDSRGIWTAPDGSCKAAFFNDPDGNGLSLTQLCWPRRASSQRGATRSYVCTATLNASLLAPPPSTRTKNLR